MDPPSQKSLAKSKHKLSTQNKKKHSNYSNKTKNNNNNSQAQRQKRGPQLESNVHRYDEEPEEIEEQNKYDEINRILDSSYQPSGSHFRFKGEEEWDDNALKSLNQISFISLDLNQIHKTLGLIGFTNILLEKISFKEEEGTNKHDDSQITGFSLFPLKLKKNREILDFLEHENTPSLQSKDLTIDSSNKNEKILDFSNNLKQEETNSEKGEVKSEKEGEDLESWLDSILE